MSRRGPLLGNRWPSALNVTLCSALSPVLWPAVRRTGVPGCSPRAWRLRPTTGTIGRQVVVLVGCVFASGGIVLYGASTSFTAAFLARLIPGAPRGLPLQRPWRLRRSALRGRSLQHRSHVQCSSAMGSVANGVLPCCSRGRPRWPLAPAAPAADFACEWRIAATAVQERVWRLRRCRRLRMRMV